MEQDPTKYLEYLKSIDFLSDFRDDNAEIIIQLNPELHSKIKCLASEEEISVSKAINVILFRHLFGTATCRIMRDKYDGLFWLRNSKASNEIGENNSVHFVHTLPSSLLQGLQELSECQITVKSDPHQLANNIINRYLFGFLSPQKISDEKGTKEIYSNHYADKGLKATLHFSESLKQNVLNESEDTEKSLNQFLLDIISEFTFGYVGCRLINSWDNDSSFSKLRLIPICNSDDRFRLNKYWGNNEKPISLQMPKQLNDDLVEVAKEIHREAQYGTHKREHVAQLCRNIAFRYFLGGLFMAKNLKN